MGPAELPIDPGPRFAIVGYAARFPGAQDADAYWDVLREGRDAISDVPKDRWDADEFFDPEPGVPGKIVTRRAGFVDDVTGSTRRSSACRRARSGRWTRSIDCCWR